MTIGLCAVLGGSERKARCDIERAGFGVRLPTYRQVLYRNGVKQIHVRPLFPGYVFPHLGPGWGVINDVNGAQVLGAIAPADEDRLNVLERHCLFGDFNRVEFRSANGQFTHGKRKRKSRRGRRAWRG